MKQEKIKPSELNGKVIDIHSHIGFSLKAYSTCEYPYCQTLEGLYYKQIACGVDINVVFPFTSDLYFDPVEMKKGNMVPAKNPISEAPYKIENQMLMKEVFDFCPELSHRFISFISIDTLREVREQYDLLLELEKTYPIYGIKISPIMSQSKIIHLLDEGKIFLDFARERNIPFIIHTTTDKSEQYSSPYDILIIAEKNPDLRFCLAHSICFHKELLTRADELPNTWVDTSALTIQVQLVRENHPIAPEPKDRIDTDFTDHKKVLLTMMNNFPETIIWGSDAPAYTYICQRKQAEGRIIEFRLKASYEDEKSALDALPKNLRTKACSTNSIKFLFG